jgi:hypothetical protein
MTVARAAWIRCDNCGDFWCTIHEAHVADCRCPGIDTWARWNLDPYAPGSAAAGRKRLTPRTSPKRPR